ncbi:ABC transporter permease [Mesorhizobium sp. BR1-1-16]|uniref:ABC transporter permease n=1 Tax=Mesorhizobium sp. BR1-1-16 TaxID=2876653 RepID=UPI001CCC3047|nr:ABC transporter permease [Mesorhizobium sp. BR1-1-16]
MTSTVRRLLLLLPTLFGVSIVVFLLLRLIPGDPAQVIMGLRATPEGLAAITRDLGLDLPLHEQYVRWLGALFSGDFGRDYRSNVPVTQLLATRLPVTLELTLLSLLLALIVAVPLGVRAAVHPNGIADKAASVLGLIGISIPDFWLGILLVLVFSLTLGMFPSSGFVPFSDGIFANLRAFALPALTLATGLSAVLVRVTRSAVTEVLSRDFVRFLKAKGLPPRAIINRHVLRNASVPIITVIGMQFGYLLGGAVIVEQVFDLPGVGSLIVTATMERNYPVVQAGMLVVALLFILVNLGTDLLYAWLNPRLRGGAR